MANLNIDGKDVKSISIDGKDIKSLSIDGKEFEFSNKEIYIGTSKGFLYKSNGISTVKVAELPSRWGKQESILSFYKDGNALYIMAEANNSTYDFYKYENGSLSDSIYSDQTIDTFDNTFVVVNNKIYYAVYGWTGSGDSGNPDNWAFQIDCYDIKSNTMSRVYIWDSRVHLHYIYLTTDNKNVYCAASNKPSFIIINSSTNDVSASTDSYDYTAYLQNGECWKFVENVLYSGSISGICRYLDGQWITINKTDNKNIDNMGIINNKIYFINEDKILYEVQDKQVNKIYELIDCSHMLVLKDTIFISYSGAISKIDISSKQLIKVTDVDGTVEALESLGDE